MTDRAEHEWDNDFPIHCKRCDIEMHGNHDTECPALLRERLDEAIDAKWSAIAERDEAREVAETLREGVQLPWEVRIQADSGGAAEPGPDPER